MTREIKIQYRERSVVCTTPLYASITLSELARRPEQPTPTGPVVSATLTLLTVMQVVKTVWVVAKSCVIRKMPARENRLLNIVPYLVQSRSLETHLMQAKIKVCVTGLT
jgi:hypothetical protein